MMKGGILAAIIAVVLVLFLVLSGAFYTVDQTEQVIITQFGKPVGDTRSPSRICISGYHSCKA